MNKRKYPYVAIQWNDPYPYKGPRYKVYTVAMRGSIPIFLGRNLTRVNAEALAKKTIRINPGIAFENFTLNLTK